MISSFVSHLLRQPIVHHYLEVATHLPEVLILELEHIDALNGHVKALLVGFLYNLASVLIRHLVYLLILFDAFGDERLDVDVGTK